MARVLVPAAPNRTSRVGHPADRVVPEGISIRRNLDLSSEPNRRTAEPLASAVAPAAIHFEE